MILAFAMFAFVASITPGPNNLLLLSAGVNHGFKSSVPLILGINIGFFVLLTAVGLGLSQIFTHLPSSFIFLKFAGATYLVYLAWSLTKSTAPAIHESATAKPPMSLMAAAAFQWVNPKAWVMAISAFSTYAPPSPSVFQVLGISFVFCIIGLPCITIWAATGTQLRRALKNATMLRAFNYCMALLLLASLHPILAS